MNQTQISRKTEHLHIEVASFFSTALALIRGTCKDTLHMSVSVLKELRALERSVRHVVEAIRILYVGAMLGM